MLKNAYLLAKIGADTAENEQHFAEMFGIMLITQYRSELQNTFLKRIQDQVLSRSLFSGFGRDFRCFSET